LASENQSTKHFRLSV